MENLTHTLIGLAAGESFARCTRAAEDIPTGRGLSRAARRSLFVTLAAIGGNSPDLDLAWSYGRSDGRLGYMLEHRGYTHTVLGCLMLGALLYGGAELWMRWRGLTPSGRDRIHLALVAVVGTWLHLAMDALNSYGVHPFWPVDNRWFYGDSLFIAEPLFWLASLPLIFIVRTAVARVLMSLVGLLAVGASAFIHAGAPLWELSIAFAAAALLVVGRLASARNAALTSVAAMALVVGVAIACGAVAARRIESLVNRQFPLYRTLDHILTPTLTDPRCWDAVIVATRGDRYAVRRVRLSLVPELVSAAACPALELPRAAARNPPGATLTQPPAPPPKRVAAPDSAAIRWLGEYSMSRDELIQLVGEHCDAAALMQFARAPFGFQYGKSWFLGDLRFGGSAAGFQIEVRAGRSARCSIHVPWVPPRADLLTSPAP